MSMNRTNIPEIRRPAEGRLRVAIPWRPGGNRSLIRSVCGHSTRPEWDGRTQRWMVARRYFLPLVEALVAQYGRVRVVTWHLDGERCGERCQLARGAECRCSCGGLNHGIRSGLDGYARDWRLVGTVASGETGWTEWRWIASDGMNASEMLAYVVEEGGRLTGEQLPVPDAEAIMAGFVRRFGQCDATRIARAAIEAHRGIWMGAPSRPGASPGPMMSSSPPRSRPAGSPSGKDAGRVTEDERGPGVLCPPVVTSVVRPCVHSGLTAT
jgi:hypothetical protein